MRDLISRQAAIDAFYVQSDDDGWWCGTAQDAEELLKGLPSAQPEQRWIPCSERLPKKIGDYLVTTHIGQIGKSIYMGTDSSKEYWMRCVVAWMPLPKPWKGEKKDG